MHQQVRSSHPQTPASRTPFRKSLPPVEGLEHRLLFSSPYHLTFDDEFNVMPAIASTVGAATPGYLAADHWQNRYLPGNGEKQYYCWPGIDTGYNPFSVDGGVLTITAMPTPVGFDARGQSYVSGELTTAPGANYPQNVRSSTPFAQQYGYFELRAKLPRGKGLWPAFWLMPSNGTQAAEYDIFEVLGHDTRSVYQTMHWSNYSQHASGPTYKGIDSADGFHTYGLLWDATTVRWYVDNVLTNTLPNQSNTPMYILMNLAVGGNWPGNPDATTPWPARMELDYLRVYSADPGLPAIAPQAGYDGALPPVIDLPPAPTSITATAVSSGQINLAWSPVVGASSYNLYRSNSAGDAGTLYRTGLTSTTLIDNGLPSSTAWYYRVAAVNLMGTSPLSAEAAAITLPAASTVTLDFSDITVNDYATVPNTYQPAALAGTGITLSWNNFRRFGGTTTNGGQDHTQSITPTAPSRDIGTPYSGSGWSNSASLSFSQPVTVPSVWVTNRDWWQQDVVLKGYAAATDATPAVTVTVRYTTIPSHATGAVTGAWVQVTGLSGVAIQRLELVGTKNNSTSQMGGALIDDLTIVPVPADPAFTVDAFAVNDPAQSQRSMVSSLLLAFPRAVQLGTPSLLLRRGDGATIPLSVDPSSDGGLTHRLRFPGQPGGSLPDGRYTLTVLAAETRDLGGRTMTGGDRTFSFHRLFGDVNGDGKVNLVDYRRLRTTLARTRTDAGFIAAFDTDNNGVINILDLSQFRRRFGMVLA